MIVAGSVQLFSRNMGTALGDEGFLRGGGFFVIVWAICLRNPPIRPRSSPESVHAISISICIGIGSNDFAGMLKATSCFFPVEIPVL